MEIKTMTDAEIKQEIAKRGGYWNYRKRELSHAGANIYPNDGSVWEMLAKRRGMSLDQYFKEFPTEYLAYRRAVSVRTGAYCPDKG